MAKNATGTNIAKATPEEITALFNCPDLLLSVIEKHNLIEQELKQIVSKFSDGN